MTERSNAVASVRPLDPDFEQRLRAARRVTKQFVYALPADEWIIRMKASDASPADCQSIFSRYWLTREMLAERTYNWQRWLNRMKLMHWFGRPCGPHVLLDDIGFDALGDMHRDHVRPSAVVETSPGNLQAWVTVAGGRKPIATRAYARELAIRYGGDMGATGNGQIGRMPASLNAKHISADNPRGCLARLYMAKYAGPQKVEITHQDPSYDAPADFSLSDMAPEVATEIYDDLYPEMIDRSKRDWRMAWALLASGFSPEDTAAVIYFGSGHAHEHSDPEGYSVRTVAKAREEMS